MRARLRRTGARLLVVAIVAGASANVAACAGLLGIEERLVFDEAGTEAEAAAPRDGSSNDVRGAMDDASDASAPDIVDSSALDGSLCADAAPWCGRIIFVSSSPLAGLELGSAEFAMCKGSADASALPYVRGRRFCAWLGYVGEPVSARLQHWAGGYTNTRGDGIANGWGDLITKPLIHPIAYDENGNPVSDLVWTQAFADGGGQPNACVGPLPSGTSSFPGDPNATTADWSAGGTSEPCTASHRVYCIEDYGNTCGLF